jgi:hypothetical protein
MAGSNTVRIQIVGDASSAKRAMADTENSLRRLEGTSAKASAGIGRLNDTFDKVGQIGMIAAGATAVTAALGDVTRAASAVEQSQGALEAVFKGNAGAMQAAAKAASSLGLSQSQYGEMAARLGSQLKNLGVAQDQLMPQTQDLIKLGTDLAATYGGDVSQAINAVSSVLRGERDPIERYGVTITEASVQAKMAAEGLSKAQATMALLYEQSADAAGQWEREQDTYAVSSAKAAAEFENMKAALGEALLPVLTKAMELFSAAANVINSIPEPIRNAAVQFGVLAVGIKLLLPALAAAKQGWFNLGVEMSQLANPTSRAAGALNQMKTALAAGAIAAAVFGIAQAFQFLAEKARESALTIDDFQRTIATHGSLSNDQIATLTQQVVDMNNAMMELEANAHANGTGNDPITRWLQGLFNSDVAAAQESIDSLNQSLDELFKSDPTAAAAATNMAFNQLVAGGMSAADAQQHLAGSLEKAKGVTVEYGEATVSATEKLAPMREEFEAASQAARDLSNAFSMLFANQDVDVAIENWRTGLAGIKEAMKDGLQASELQKFTQDWNAVSTAMANNGATADQVMAKYDVMRGQMEQALASVGIKGREADGILDYVFGKRREVRLSAEAAIQKAKETEAAVNGITQNKPVAIQANDDQAQQAIESVTQGLNAMPRLVPVDITVNVTSNMDATSQALLSGNTGSFASNLWDEPIAAVTDTGITDVTLNLDDEAADTPMAAALGGLAGGRGGRLAPLLGLSRGGTNGYTITIPIRLDFQVREWSTYNDAIQGVMATAMEASQANVKFWQDNLDRADKQWNDYDKKITDRMRKLRDKYNDLGGKRKSTLSAGINALMDPKGIRSLVQNRDALEKGLKDSRRWAQQQERIIKRMQKIGKQAARNERSAIRARRKNVAELRKANQELGAQNLHKDYIKYLQDELQGIDQLASRISSIDIGRAFSSAESETQKWTQQLTKAKEELASAWNPSQIKYWTAEKNKALKGLRSTSVKSQLNEQLAATFQFNRRLQTLAARGMSKALLQDLASMGAGEGNDIAKALVNNKALAARYEGAFNTGMRMSRDTATKLRGSIYDSTYQGTLQALKDAYAVYDIDAGKSKRSAGRRGNTVIINGALDPLAVGKQVRKILRDYDRSVGRKR